MKNWKLTQGQFAELLGITPAAVAGLNKRGKVFRDADGLYDLKNVVNRALVKERGLKLSDIKINPPKPAGRRPGGVQAPGVVTSPGRVLTSVEQRELNLVLRNEKLKIENDVKRGQLLDRDKVREGVFFYLDRIFSNLERLANTYLDDVANVITADGLTAECRSLWRNRVMSEIDTAKNETVKRLNELGGKK